MQLMFCLQTEDVGCIWREPLNLILATDLICMLHKTSQIQRRHSEFFGDAMNSW